MEKIIMSYKETEQVGIFARLKNGEITQRNAAQMLSFSVRWIRKKFKRYLAAGAQGLTHRNRGKPSSRKWNDKEKCKAKMLLEGEFKGFGPTFAVEKLWELYKIKVSVETLRKAMIKWNFWKKQRKRSKHRKRRERKSALGQLVQLDGSPHDWFEGRASKCTLIVFIDDATSRLLHIQFVKCESTNALMDASKGYFLKHGRPCVFYVDHGSVFSVNLNNSERDKLTQWERAMKELNINVKHAHSPQAKGRVERVNRTLQDRLIKEMRLANICSIEAANQFVQSYLKKHNRKFAVEATKSVDLHRQNKVYNLDKILCLKHERLLKNDFTITYKKRIFQLSKQQRTIIRPKNSITTNEHLDGSITLSIRAIDLCFMELKQHSKKTKQLVEKQIKSLKIYKPTDNHPWKTYHAIDKANKQAKKGDSRVKQPNRRLR